MFFVLPELAKVYVSLELLCMEGGVAINTCNSVYKAKYLIMGYPLSFTKEGVHANKHIYLQKHIVRTINSTVM